MKHFTVYSKQTANRAAAELLDAVENMIGFVPNIFGVIAASTPGLHGFVELNNQFALSSFDETEREIIQTATSVERECTYCVAGHTAFAHMQKVDTDVIDAIRNNQPVADSKLQALNVFTRALVTSKGMIHSLVLEDFLAAGYQPRQVLEVILGICVKTFSNLTNNTIGIPLDDEFKPYQWAPVSIRKSGNNQAA